MRSLFGITTQRGRGRDRVVTLTAAVTGGLITAALWSFNQVAGSYEYYLVGNALALFFVPMLVILALGEDPMSFGFAIGDSRRVRWLTIVLFAGLLVILVPAARFKGLQDYYPIFKQWNSFAGGRFTEDSFRYLLYGWASYGMYMFFWEFFFRGYLLFGLARTISWPAVIIQAIPFCLLHWHKMRLEFIASFPAGIILGIIALRGRSFIPAFLLHWAAAIAFDVLILISKRG